MVNYEIICGISQISAMTLDLCCCQVGRNFILAGIYVRFRCVFRVCVLAILFLL